ncbi:hypothetical protein C6341_g17406 [Phytophthora cactorum]|nr:hypothetical protein C6341_g17406 [Phytophthora cactorum]
MSFMANGQLSRAMEVTSGIKQSCPLAPLLFIIAADILYDEIHNTQAIEGITLHSGHKSLQLRVAGYADDTAIYIATAAMQKAAVEALERFSDVSV